MADLSQRCVSIYHQGLEAKGNTLVPISWYLLRFAPRKTEFWTPYCQILSLPFVRFRNANSGGFLLKPSESMCLRINGIRIVPRNCYFRKGQAVPSTSLPQHFRDPMALPWQLSVLHKWQDGPPELLFSKGAEARVAFSISTFLRPNGIALTTSALVSDPSTHTSYFQR